MKLILMTLLVLSCFCSVTAQKRSTFEEAEDAYFSFQYKDAAQLYTTLLIEDDPEWNYYIYYRRAYCYYGLKEYDKALQDAKKALSINSKNDNYRKVKGQSFWLMASIFSEQGAHEKAVEYLTYTSKILNESLIWNNIGYSQLKIEKYEDALEAFNKALELNIENPYSFSNRSFVYLKLGQLDKAQEDLKKALEFDPYNPYAYKYKGILHLELGESDKACEAFNKAKELGYETFNLGQSADSEEVNDLIKEHCATAK
ncbi:tetratricopeptide repeat protein [Aureispira sp. CCB-E]|uniref:tetratricopeptide repeat protein n=1 Tax=Aureispira sp. CCB-E TaxID=3051121 RepID=UPI0028697FE4|nr:tetratricopeptide repeat protein [Aureispira sp. CCB-E]WMX13684.1 tetratricopeptide repeat protein [Aureispira sp. CCB-E]